MEIFSPLEEEVKAVYCLYYDLARDFDGDAGLGGRFVFVGEPAGEGTQILRAANIAGAASLAASADAAALRLAMREGALDFVVTDLDEALRILKNEIRKKLPVAVGVSLSPQVILGEMVKRGVQPDLLGPGVQPAEAEIEVFRLYGSRTVQASEIPAGWQFCVESLANSSMAPAAYDEFLLSQLSPGDEMNRRWIRLAPRYLPAATRRLRSFARMLSPS